MASLRDIAQEEADDQFRQEAALRSVNAQWSEWPVIDCPNGYTSVCLTLLSCDQYVQIEQDVVGVLAER